MAPISNIFRRNRRTQVSSEPTVHSESQITKPISVDGAIAQTQSLFFSRLPYDVRLLVYSHILTASSPLHIVQWANSPLHNTESKIAHVACKDVYQGDDPHGLFGQEILHTRCWGQRIFQPGDPLDMGKQPRSVDGEKMELLTACKRIYAETHPLLYTTNTFSFNTLAGFQIFTESLSSTHLQHIRSLHLTLYHYAWFPHSSVEDLRHVTCPSSFKWEWKAACNTLVRMQGLRELKVMIGFSVENRAKAACVERVWFEGLRKVGVGREMRVFEVWVNWEAREDGERDVDGGWPFQIMSPGKKRMEDGS